MPFEKTEYIWKNGEFVKWEDASVHLMSHVVHYGTSPVRGNPAATRPSRVRTCSA